MNITVETDPSLLEIEVIVCCAAMDDQVESIVTALSLSDRRIVGRSDDETRFLAAGSILYFESVDRRTFAYTAHEVFEVVPRLYELEEKLEGCGFERVAKGCVVNLCRIESLRPSVGGRLLATLDNGEDLIISRSYAKAVKKRLSL